ncbi:hypothetical protein SRHO_G00036380 [Serrasalmus rhombeus]
MENWLNAKVSEQLNAELEQPLDEQELHAALQSMKGGTALGTDGLPDFRIISAARVNWRKSETFAGGDGWLGRKADFNSLRQWWDVGKAQIRLFCQQYTSYATEEKQRIIAALERDLARLEQQIGGQDCESVQAELEELHHDMGAFLLDRAKDLSKLALDNKDMLDLPLTLDELKTAAFQMSVGRAPVIDGLPMEFYKTSWDHTGQDLLSVLSECIKHGQLPLSCRRAVLTLLSKKGDLCDLRNWCPLALLCTDYKILSKTLSSRLKGILDTVVHRDQAYCIPGRSILDNLFLTRDMMELSNRLPVDFGLISLDQEKAFDRVDHAYLFNTLLGFGFGENLINYVKPLYTDASYLMKVGINSQRLLEQFLSEVQQALSQWVQELLELAQRDATPKFSSLRVTGADEGWQENRSTLLTFFSPSLRLFEDTHGRALHAVCVKVRNLGTLPEAVKAPPQGECGSCCFLTSEERPNGTLSCLFKACGVLGYTPASCSRLVVELSFQDC